MTKQPGAMPNYGVNIRSFIGPSHLLTQVGWLVGKQGLGQYPIYLADVGNGLPQ